MQKTGTFVFIVNAMFLYAKVNMLYLTSHDIQKHVLPTIYYNAIPRYAIFYLSYYMILFVMSCHVM